MIEMYGPTDPVLDEEGHNKPKRRRGTHSPDLSLELSRRVGRRVVAYRDHDIESDSRSPILWGSPTYYQYAEDTCYLFVAGFKARIVTKVTAHIYVNEALDRIAKRLMWLIAGQEDGDGNEDS